MAKVYTNSMIARAGVVSITTADGRVVSRYQAILPALRRVDYGDNKEHIVAPGDTWQNISVRFLGTAELWWLIAEFNRVLDPFTELTAGRRLIIPSPNRVRLSTLADV
jgi:nucleoid-associated protein YgaU